MDSAQKSITSLIDGNDMLEKRLNLFIKELQDMGLNKEQIDDVITKFTSIATQQTIAKISALMDEKDWENWKKFVDTGANTAQQLIVLNRLLINKSGKDLNTINVDIIESLATTMIDDLKMANDVSLKISNLSPEDVAKAQELLDAGDFIGADQIIDKK